MVTRSASMTRDARARSRSQSKEPGYYSRCRSSSPARTSGQSQFNSNLQYYRPNEVNLVSFFSNSIRNDFFSLSMKETCCSVISLVEAAAAEAPCTAPATWRTWRSSSAAWCRTDGQGSSWRTQVLTMTLPEKYVDSIIIRNIPIFISRPVPGPITCPEVPKLPVKFWDENILLPD